MEEENLFQAREELTQFRADIDRVKAEIGTMIVGQTEMVDLMLVALLANGHLLIEGVPGVAKTLAAKMLARTLDVLFARIQFTPDLMPSDVLGTSVFNAQSGNFDFRAGPIFAQVVLIDEINRAPAKTQSALFEVMEERQVTIDGKTLPMEPPFMVLATQNPIEQEGTYRLPEAQLDRFLFKIEVGYPSAEEEARILLEHHARKAPNDLSHVQAVLDQSQILRARAVVQQVTVDPKLVSYIVSLIGATRESKDIFLGASPRASISLMNAAKALAAMRGRDFITPEDVEYLAVPVLRHRIQLTPEREMEGGTPEAVIRKLIEQMEVPR
jgi:MoxR-like ATPase